MSRFNLTDPKPKEPDMDEPVPPTETKPKVKPNWEHAPPVSERTFRRSDVIAEFVGAMAKAQAEMSVALKDAANPYFKSKYADLATVIAAVREPLTKNGIAFLQFARASEGGVEVETLLAHESGEWVSETLALPVAKLDAQGIGSAITYAKRYGLQAMVGLPSDDDDGNSAADSAKKMRDAGLKIMDVASKKGTEALQLAWKAMNNEMRTVCKNDLERFKEIAAGAGA